MTDSRNSRKVRTGVVTSVSGAKTIVVTVNHDKRSDTSCGQSP